MIGKSICSFFYPWSLAARWWFAFALLQNSNVICVHHNRVEGLSNNYFGLHTVLRSQALWVVIISSSANASHRARFCCCWCRFYFALLRQKDPLESS